MQISVRKTFANIILGTWNNIPGSLALFVGQQNMWKMAKYWCTSLLSTWSRENLLHWEKRASCTKKTEKKIGKKNEKKMKKKNYHKTFHQVEIKATSTLTRNTIRIIMNEWVMFNYGRICSNVCLRSKWRPGSDLELRYEIRMLEGYYFIEWKQQTAYILYMRSQERGREGEGGIWKYWIDRGGIEGFNYVYNFFYKILFYSIFHSRLLISSIQI